MDELHELLVPEVSMDVDESAEMTERNESFFNNVDSIEERSFLTKDLLDTLNAGGIVASPVVSDSDDVIPHSEQNGETITLDDDDDDSNNQNDAVTDLTTQSETPSDSANQNETTTDPDLALLNCDVILEENGSPASVACVETNHAQEPEKSTTNDASSNRPTSNVDNVSITEFGNLLANDEGSNYAKHKRKSKRYLQPAQIPKDYTSEELEIYNSMFSRGNQAIQFLRHHCTACNTHLGSAPNKQHKRFIHPLLKVLICRSCYEFYGSGEFDKDEDGSELYCRWCGQGGKVLCCAKCPFVFCQRCIKTNLGKSKLQEVLASEDWCCFECVPSQTIKLRVCVRALYDFVQSEINLAAELNQPERLKQDNSLCCRFKTTPKIKIKLPIPKRKNSTPTDDLAKDESHIKRKKIKLKTLSSLLTESIENNINMPVHKGNTYINPLAVTPQTWEPQVEDEVVCTPDLSLLMPVDNEDDDRESSQLSTPTHVKKSTNSKKTQYPYIIDHGQPTTTPKNLGYVLPKNPVIINTSTTRPLLSKSINKNTPNTTLSKYTGSKLPSILSNSHQNRNNVVPSNLIPGTKYEWFEKASQFTTRINSNLSSRLDSLTKEQSGVNSLEGLAFIHNSFQELLNSSIRSLTQVRKNLRSDFITGLKTIKYNSESAKVPPKKNIHDDNDVIIVDTTPATKSAVPTGSGLAGLGRLKLKPVSSLVMDNVIITIPDDVYEPSIPTVVSEDKPSDEVVTVEKDDNVIEVKERTPSPSPETRLDPETQSLIRKALQESKLETIITENMKLNTPDEIATDLVKRMLSVRVVVENAFSPATPKMRPRSGYTPMQISKEDENDIENLLSSSIVLNVSKQKVFNENGESDSVLPVNDQVQHLSNGIV